MPRWSLRGLAMAIMCLAQITTACTAAGPDASPAGSVRPATASALASPTPGACPSLGGSPTCGASPSPGASPTSGGSPSPSSVEPPTASLAAEGGDPVIGQLGSFTWDGGGSDSPWLPGAPLIVGTGERLSVTLGGGVGPADWSARRVPAGTADGSGAVELGGGPSPVTFSAPGPGSWSVQVLVRFTGGLGSAAYYWQLTVR